MIAYGRRYRVTMRLADGSYVFVGNYTGVDWRTALAACATDRSLPRALLIANRV